MRHREQRLGYTTNENPDCLVIGLKVYDGIHFPDFAKETHRADFEAYFVDGPAFSLCPLHIDFQKAIRPFAEDVARIVKNVPPWSPEWATAAWVDDIVAGIRMPDTPKVPQPLLA